MRFKKTAAVFVAMVAIFAAFSALSAEDCKVFAEDSEAQAPAKTEAKAYTTTSGYVLNYRLYRSPSYDRSDGSKPAMLIYYFHDDAAKGSDNASQLDESLLSALISDETEKLYGQTYRYIIVAPQCPADECFVNLPESGGYTADEVPETEIMKAAKELIDEIQAMEILLLQTNEDDMKGVKLLAAGVGSGATAAYDFACRHTDSVDRILTVGGVCDPAHIALMCNADMIKALIFAEQDNKSVLSLNSMSNGSISINFAGSSLEDCLSFALAYGEPALTEWAIAENYAAHNFKISVSCNENGGRISVSPETVPHGGSAAVTVTVNAGYALKSVKVNGSEADVKVFKQSKKTKGSTAMR